MVAIGSALMGNANDLKATWKQDELFTKKKYNLVSKLEENTIFFQTRCSLKAIISQNYVRNISELWRFKGNR